jgi:hypothetical protein
VLHFKRTALVPPVAAKIENDFKMRVNIVLQRETNYCKIIIIVVVIVVVLPSSSSLITGFLSSGTSSLKPLVYPTTQASSF